MVAKKAATAAKKSTATKAPAPTPEAATAPATAERADSTGPDRSEVRIRLLQKMTGERNGKPWPAKGEEVTVTSKEAKALIGQQVAEAV